MVRESADALRVCTFCLREWRTDALFLQFFSSVRQEVVAGRCSVMCHFFHTFAMTYL